MKSYPLFTFNLLNNYEIFLIELESNYEHFSQSHNSGVEEYILGISGKCKIILDSEEIVVEEGEALNFKADISHTYCNPFERKYMIYNLIFYNER